MTSDVGNSPSLGDNRDPEDRERRRPLTDLDRTAMTFRERTRRLVEAKIFQAAVMVLIVVNSVTQGLETWPPAATTFGSALKTFDHAVVVVFCVEILVRLFAYGGRFFRDPWSVFDFAVVAVSVAATSDSLSVLRALRVLRVLRLVSAVPRMRRVVAALLHAVPGVASVAALLLLVFYVFSVMATKLFGPAFPAWFGSIGESMFSLFQIMTLESWSMSLVRPVMELYPWRGYSSSPSSWCRVSPCSTCSSPSSPTRCRPCTGRSRRRWWRT